MSASKHVRGGQGCLRGLGRWVRDALLWIPLWILKTFTGPALRQQLTDVNVLWPAMLQRARGNPELAGFMFALHCATDPAWREVSAEDINWLVWDKLVPQARKERGVA